MKSPVIRVARRPDAPEPRPTVKSTQDGTIDVHVQNGTALQELPPATFFETCVRHALEGRRDCAQLTIRLVDHDESRALNRRWRGMDRPTNVLSFPMDDSSDVAPPLLGDIAICAPLVRDEADAQGKSRDSHWAHLVVHGTLHLVGFDHENEDDANAMEALECRILASMGYPDPYAS